MSNEIKKSKTGTIDMTEGNPIKLILLFSIPVIIGNIFQQFYSMVDAMIVGKFVGSDALAAVGSTGSLVFTTLGFSIGLTVGFSIIISQKFGAGDIQAVRKVIAMSIYLSLIFASIMTVFGFIFSRPLLQMLDTPADILDHATSYLQLMFAGSIGLIFYNLFACILRAVGDSKTPLWFLILASVLNVILDLVFVVTIPLGTAGVGLATTLAQTISAVLCALYACKKHELLRLTKEDFAWSTPVAVHLLKFGTLSAFQMSVTGIGTVIVQVAVNGFGTSVVAAYTSASKIQNLVIQPLLSVGNAVSTYSAQNLGAKKLERIHEGVHKSLVLVVIFTIVAVVCCYGFGDTLTLMFVGESETEVIALSSDYLKLISPFYLVLGLLFIYRSALHGVGNALLPMISGFLELLMRFLATMIFPVILGFPGVPYVELSAWLGATILLFIGYYWQMNSYKKNGI